MLLLLLIPSCIAYCIYAARVGSKIRRSDTLGAEDTRALVGGFAVSGLGPLGTALIMIYIFLIGGTATTVQLNADAGRGLWSLWVDLFPALLLVAALSGTGNLVWALRCSLKAPLREKALPAWAATLLSGLTFFTVASFCPMA